MTQPVWQVDSFTDQPFRGNPAGVVVLGDERSADWMQAVAAEMNLSETAFVRRRGDAEGWDLRWFTPAVEVDLCGHATLATAHVLLTEGLAAEDRLAFHTRSGVLLARRAGGRLELDFPARPVEERPPAPGLLEALGIQARWVGQGLEDWLVELAAPSDVAAVRPDFRRLAVCTDRGVIVTAEGGDGCDFSSRFFAPAVGIDEDPVTGSAHCYLAPFWGERLGRDTMVGRQISARGGTVHVRREEDRVILGGHAVTVLKGELLA